MSNLELQVEFIIGTSIEDVCDEMSALAKKLGIMVSTNFNGVNVIETPKSIPSRLASEWQTSLDNGYTYKTVID